jgi:tetratricopeptide (TPR) repeat protein
MIPEVLSSNKTPYLRQQIKQIIDHLGSNHIRETELSLFDYKFYSRTLGEISFLSKIFEQEAAGFNFTLDESYLVKLHIGTKIKELRSIYYKFLGTTDTNRQIFSISHLNEILGDLHFFDQEYDDAITAYSDGIKPLGQVDIGAMDLRDFVTLIKNKLKLGLCFEKTNSYEEALALYTDCCKDAKEFMVGRLVNGRPFDINELKEYKRLKGTVDKNFSEIVFYSSALSNQLHIILQGFLAKMFMQEKLGIEGISDLKLSIAMGGFLKMMEGFLDPQGRNHMLKANAYMFMGKLLYFKNNQVDFKLRDTLNQNKRILPQGFFDQIHQLIANN